MACGVAPAQFLPVQRRGADYRFLVFAPGVAGKINIPQKLVNDPNVLDVGTTLREGDEIRELRTTAERAGFLVSLGDTLEQAVERADEGCREISIEYADGMIGHARELHEFRELVH